MPRVLRIINRFNLGGPTYNVAYLTKYMAPEFETLLVGGVKDGSEDSSEFIVENLGIEPVLIAEMRRSLNPLNDIKTYRRIKKIIKEFKPDIVHTHASKAGAVGRLAAYNCKVPVIIHTFHGHVFHSYFNPFITFAFKAIERFLAKRTTKIIAISERQKYELSKIHKIAHPDKFAVVPLGFDLSRFETDMDLKRKAFRKQYEIADDEIAISIVGRLVPIKNHGLFLEGIKILKEKSDKKIRAFIVGDGELRKELENKAGEFGLTYTDFLSGTTIADVTFTSWITDVDRVYAGTDIVVLSSLNEGTPVSLIEAQAAKCAIVSTKVGGVENVVRDGESALLCESNDVKGLVNAMVRLLDDRELRKDFGERGNNYVMTRYNYETLIRNTKNLYYDLI